VADFHSRDCRPVAVHFASELNAGWKTGSRMKILSPLTHIRCALQSYCSPNPGGQNLFPCQAMEGENEMIRLSPAQQKTFDTLMEGIGAFHIVLLKGGACSERTTILQSLRDALGGVLLGARQFMDTPSVGEPFAIEEAFLRMVEQALGEHHLVFVDDVHLLTQLTPNCDYPRAYLLDAALTAMIGDTAPLKKKLVFATEGPAPWPILRRAFCCEIGDFQPDH
jgi:hypothetical protein